MARRKKDDTCDARRGRALNSPKRGAPGPGRRKKHTEKMERGEMKKGLSLEGIPWQEPVRFIGRRKKMRRSEKKERDPR